MKKKKGSSLVLVLLLGAAIMMVGTVSITSVSMNVKMRVEENKRIQSLYGADAGLEYANSLIAKTYDSAIVYAENVVSGKIQENYSSDSTENLTQDEEMNKLFKQSFIKFINSDKDFNDYVDSNQFLQAIEKMGYANVEKDYINLEFSTTTDELPLFEAAMIQNATYGNTPSSDNETYKFTLASEFTSVSGGINNKRQLEVTYEIEIPDYRGQYTSQNIDIFKVFYDKVITADGNLVIDGTNQASISGDVFIVGNPEYSGTPNLVYDKYKGGIQITKAKVIFNDDVMTAKTFNVFDGGEATVGESLYARNLYLGNVDGNVSTGKIYINKEAVLDNDLTLKANGGEVVIKDFYGLNDKTYKGQDIHPDDDQIPGNDVTNPNQTVDRVSSSIIINGNEDTTLKIKNSAYIMGVAYINTVGEQYQTGESIAVKGNYVAYSHPLPKSEKPNSEDFSQAEFNYYEPLQLVDRLDGTQLSVLQKSEYFEQFYGIEGNGNPDDGQVELPNLEDVYAAGAIVYKTSSTREAPASVNVLKSQFDIRAQDKITGKREEFATKVYGMGNTDIELEKLYNSMGVGSSDGKANQARVKDLIDWGNLKDNCGKYECQTDTIKLVLPELSGTKKTVVIGSNASNSIYSDSKYIKFKDEELDKTGDIKPKIEAIILIDGDVIIDGTIDFTGNIIATGDVKVIGTGNQEIKYKAETTNSIIAKNYLQFKDVFKGTPISTQLVNSFDNQGSIQYTPEDYIHTNNWKILK